LLKRWLLTYGNPVLGLVLGRSQGTPNSHADQGWEKLTDAIIQAINQNRSDVVFLLWGAKAQVWRERLASLTVSPFTHAWM
jgi:uracil DNA glycosylase